MSNMNRIVMMLMLRWRHRRPCNVTLRFNDARSGERRRLLGRGLDRVAALAAAQPVRIATPCAAHVTFRQSLLIATSSRVATAQLLLTPP